ncbi:hypothetical protein B296_00016863 [Ensete ventricosum]|uniref:Uncharacterized protein n=1 Tax=Ensete ventricosum TaxID=4639 RepID=A0A426Z5S3_ENSVE|nr:hypothetical protein B296_00016863 [Ensete ventricosum]
MDLFALHSMLKVFASKSTLATRVTPSLLEVEEVHMETTPRTAPAQTQKRQAEKLVPRQEDPTRTHKRVKVAVGKHKSQHGEGSSRVPSKDTGSVASSAELTLLAYCRPKSMKELCRMTVRKNDKRYYVVQMIDLPSQYLGSEMRTRWANLKSLAQA